MKDIIIIGTGIIAREVAKIIEAINLERDTWNIIGFISTDDRIEVSSFSLDEYKVISDLENMYAYFENRKKDKFYFFKRLESKNDLFVIVAIDNYNLKKEIVYRLDGKVKFAKIIHPSVKGVNLDNVKDGCILYPGLVVIGDLQIGKHSIVKQSCSFGNNIKIGEYSYIAFNNNIDSCVNIGDCVYMDPNSTILANSTIDNGSYIKTGSLIY